MTKTIKNFWRNYHSSLLLALVMSLCFAPQNVIWALMTEETPTNFIVQYQLTSEIVRQGTTTAAFGNNFKLIFSPLSATSTLEMAETTGLELQQINEEWPTPWNLRKVSDFYQFDFQDKFVGSFEVQITYQETSKNHEYKQVFFFDNKAEVWRPLVTKDYPEKNYVRAKVEREFARLAVFSYPDVITTGQASWYKYKGGNFAASPDFPKGSRVRVHNLANGKFVDVTINDYGPNRLLYPNRAIDLDKVAFKKIASTGAGLINVKIEPLEIKADSGGRFLGVLPSGATLEPKITAQAALVMRESDGEVLWSKNADQAVPLASLTKLVAVKTFLDENENSKRLAEVVKYSVQDEKNNYNYCRPSESARLKVANGDELTIKDLIYSSLVGSTNNTVESLVRVSGLERSVFIARMNEKVQAWGATSTKFIEPTGLSPKNVSSAHDYALITKEVVKDPVIKAASTLMKYSFKTVNTKKAHTIYNTNSLLGLYRYPITLSKTGYLQEAGYCLMNRVKSGDDHLIVVTFNSKNRQASFFEGFELIRYGLSQPEKSTVTAASLKP